jgi:hypothetical protein
LLALAACAIAAAVEARNPLCSGKKGGRLALSERRRSHERIKVDLQQELKGRRARSVMPSRPAKARAPQRRKRLVTRKRFDYIRLIRRDAVGSENRRGASRAALSRFRKRLAD